MDAPHGCWLSVWRKSLKPIIQESYELYWTSPRGNTPQNSSYTATKHPSWKQSKIRWTRHVGHCWRSKDELISNVLWSNLSHAWAKVGQPARIYLQQLRANTNVAWKIFRELWMIRMSGEIGLGRSVLAAQHDDLSSSQWYFPFCPQNFNNVIPSKI